ncbi:exported hypothetical protein [uncultured delta proteobacterium]|uniref:Uncharacterized protein n=1 Tax=uncultured delta proteobacterium TaxID=34034 RepID=A0A212KDT6_9DELT|nr:exported hypothetical protein [uncultured delta proteobacterium]
MVFGLRRRLRRRKILTDFVWLLLQVTTRPRPSFAGWRVPLPG